MGVLRDEPKPAQAEDNKKEKPKKKKLLTISKIARKLRMMEGSSRYEDARFHASKIGWEGICSLVEVGHPENDPNLMPSRFMILPGASDEGLRKRGNLNNYPYSVHPDTPKQMSVYNLKQFLILGGYLAGEKPFWQSKDQLSKEQLQQLKQDGGLENDVVAPLTGAAEMDDKVEAALNSFLSNQSLDEPKGGGSYTVKEGDTLSAIAQQHKLPNWQALWNFNKHVIKNPDLIYPGDELDIPDLADNEFEPWFYEFDNGEDVWRGSKHYQFPAHYFSLTLLDREGKEIKDKIKSEFNGYLDTPHLFYGLSIEKPDEVRVLMPISSKVASGFKKDEFLANEITLKAFEKVLYGSTSNSASLNFDADDDEELVPENVELA
jgi:LysM repeat protein